VQELNRKVQVVNLRTLNEEVNNTLVREYFIAQLAGFFSLFALLLASIGLYGVMAFTVTRRTREIGIRMALGAHSRTVLWLVLRETMALVAIGAVIGLVAALFATKLAGALLFDLKPNDPLTLAAATLLLLAVATLAGFLPARRASRVDPMSVLRDE